MCASTTIILGEAQFAQKDSLFCPGITCGGVRVGVRSCAYRWKCDVLEALGFGLLSLALPPTSGIQTLFTLS